MYSKKSEKRKKKKKMKKKPKKRIDKQITRVPGMFPSPIMGSQSIIYQPPQMARQEDPIHYLKPKQENKDDIEWDIKALKKRLEEESIRKAKTDYEPSDFGGSENTFRQEQIRNQQTDDLLSINRLHRERLYSTEPNRASSISSHESLTHNPLIFTGQEVVIKKKKKKKERGRSLTKRNP